MKIVNGLSIFTIIIFLASCFDPPEFPVTPQISFVDLKYYENPDSLALFINFKDGDGDLGLPQTLTDSPYHEVNYFLEDGTGKLTPVVTQTRHSSLLPFIKVNANQQGQLTRLRTKKNPLYSYLPTYGCAAYQYDSVYVGREDIRIFNQATYNFKKKVHATIGEYYIVTDTFYYEQNPNHFNIEVEFLLKDPNSQNLEHPGFTKFDWRQANFCTIAYDEARFPVLSEPDNALEGTLRYDMVSKSNGFKLIFSIKEFKLRIKIRDRALNESNIIDTDVVTLDKIREARP